jgi:demethylmenaquinone methyltransferase/2-methoxy-6-polyprenyl-1,4-benzoquinol methylase
VLARVARLAGTIGVAYDYLYESIRDWTDQRTLSGWIREAGWTDVEYRNLTFGIVALHRARKPGA